MGQGSYNAIGYGVLLDKKLEKYEEENFDRIDAARDEDASGLRIRTSYESVKPYWAIFLYDSCDGEMPATDTLKRVLEFEPTAKVVKRWEKFCKDIGLDLKPTLLWISDYD